MLIKMKIYNQTDVLEIIEIKIKTLTGRFFAFVAATRAGVVLAGVVVVVVAVEDVVVVPPLVDVVVDVEVVVVAT